MNNKIFSYDIFFSGRKTPYPLLSISYANYVQQYLQTLCIKKKLAKEKDAENKNAESAKQGTNNKQAPTRSGGK